MLPTSQSFIAANKQSTYKIKKLCLDEEEELMEYEVLRNKALKGDIELQSVPERIYDNKLGRLYVVVEWIE